MAEYDPSILFMPCGWKHIWVEILRTLESLLHYCLAKPNYKWKSKEDALAWNDNAQIRISKVILVC